MTGLDFTYSTYQDVRRNLFKYSVPFLIAAGFAAYGFILPAPHQSAILELLQKVATIEPWKSLVGIGTGTAGFAFLAFLMTELLKLHDRWYDKYVVRWRADFDIMFILPRLLQPFISRTNQRFWIEAVRNRHHFMERLYYVYVGDLDAKIPKNMLVRFYETVTVYWLTQINELVLATLLFVCAVYSATGFVRVDHGYAVRLLWTALTIVGLLALNRLWIRRERRSVNRAAAAEIQAIHDDEELKADLGARFRSVCEDHGVPYE
jgi:hypothetical protein